MFKKREKGLAGVLIITTLFIISVFIGIISLEIGRAYTDKCNTQTVADSVANGVGAYASEGSSLNLTKATQMLARFEKYYPGYTFEFDRAAVNDNHIKLIAKKDTVFNLNQGLVYNLLGAKKSLQSYADVELVPQSQLSKIKSAFPADRMLPVNPFVTGDSNNSLANNPMLVETLISQFYVEGRNRYRYSGEQRTIYGDLSAHDLLLFDVFTTFGYSASFNNWRGVDINDTKGQLSDKAFTDGYIYTGVYEGLRYIVSNPNEETQATILYLDITMEKGMSLKKVNFSDLSSIQRSPTKWYTPKNESEVIKKENTTTFD